MPCFKCEQCGCVENTAVSNYWTNGETRALCSECDPEIGVWHGLFEKVPADKYLLGSDGFLYSQKEVENGALKWREENQGFKIIGPA